jgi:hypothetical protein
VNDWTELIRRIDRASLDDLAEWKQIAEMLRDRLTPEERQQFTALLDRRLTILEKLQTAGGAH